MSDANKWRVPLIDLPAAQAELRPALLASLERVLDSGRYILGPELNAFEREVAQHLGVPFACGVSNGTDALVCALAALGIGAQARVLTSPFTFFATASAIVRSGARLVFADVDLDSFNLSLGSLSGAQAGASVAAEGQGVEAVVAVHLFGQPAPVAELRAALGGQVHVVEDAAQAFGAASAAGVVGALGDAAAFSFFPGKPLGALGDAGLVTSGTAAVDARCRRLRAHGRSAATGEFVDLGGNYRLDELHAAALRVKLQHERPRRLQRAQRALQYNAAFAQLPQVITPQVMPGNSHAWSVYALRILSERERLRQHLSARGIETALYYPRPLHLEPALRSLGYARGDFPNAELLSEQVLALPVSADLSAEQQAWVIDSVLSFFGS